MMEIGFDFELAKAIPVETADVRQLGAAEWAAQAVSRFTAVVDVPVALRPRLQGALESVAAEVSDDARRFLLVGTDAAVLAPLVFFVVDRELTRQEQADFLWAPSAILPPASLRVETAHLGVGFSSTLAQREDGVDFGTRRWLFFGQGLTAGALLGPVAPYSLAVAEPIAESILSAARVEGFVPLANHDRVEELLAAVVRAGDEWKA
ncbi:hypothetical protein [Microbacterium sp. LWH10-1.2]|uniref:hypothetical protein n=1 Tax=unclassified Microbacterium TaxID=2609290 RepID=UPI00313A3F0A